MQENKISEVRKMQLFSRWIYISVCVCVCVFMMFFYPDGDFNLNTESWGL